ncbi:hypothetical protein ElyMa_004195500 [Elysia marginata]|uniref:Uncharacterized protein n=1 Tax=Elysia marginata TaxID=1093978 RepID=A0AAV4GLF3_9GAST|nr:hypothetical protein ElyMa_004195500 [Elysia marginata]
MHAGCAFRRKKKIEGEEGGSKNSFCEQTMNKAGHDDIVGAGERGRGRGGHVQNWYPLPPHTRPAKISARALARGQSAEAITGNFPFSGA